MHCFFPRCRFQRTAAALASFAAALICSPIHAQTTVAPAPVAPLHPVTDTYEGPNGPVTVTDNYRWLEDAHDPAVKAWSDAQSGRARAYLEALPGHNYIAGELHRFFTVLPTGYVSLAPRPNGLFALCYNPKKQQPYLVIMPSDSTPQLSRTVFDPNVTDPSADTAIDWFVPSQSGRLVGVAEMHGGSEDSTLHIYETATGRELPDQVVRVSYPTAGGSIAWNADDTGFYYTRYPQPGERTGADEYNFQQVYFHKLGTPVAQDTYARGKDFPSIAETTLQSSRDGRYIVAEVKNGDGGQKAFYLHEPSGIWEKVAGNEDGVTEAHFGGGDALYLLSRHAGLNGSVLRLPAGEAKLAQAQMVVPPSSTSIDTILPTQNTLYVFSISGGPSALAAYSPDGARHKAVLLPPVSSAREPVWTTGDTLLYVSGSFTHDDGYMRYAPEQKKSVFTALLPPSPDQPADLIVRREFAVSKDGTRVPMSIVMRRGTRLNGSNPTLIYGYGGYGASERPQFDPNITLWCHSGGIFVDTNIRGGGEYGDAWHKAGNLTHKQNVFDDFAACAQHLIDRGYTRPGKLAARGASNGGVLMGAQITQHPGLYQCVVSEVGWYDALRMELSPNGPTNTTEFGTVTNPAQFAAMYAYSPYHHVQDGTRYPDILLVTGDNDGRVDPMNSRKFMARLQAAAAPGSVLLLRTSATAGHGFGTSLDEAIGKDTDEQAFLMHELGMTPGGFHTKQTKPRAAGTLSHPLLRSACRRQALR